MMPRKGHKNKKKLEWEKYKFDAPEGTWKKKKKKKKNYSWLHFRGSVKKKIIKKKITILCRSFEAPYLSDKTNRIKIGWEMKEKKQFMWFETNFQAPN